MTDKTYEDVQLPGIDVPEEKQKKPRRPLTPRCPYCVEKSINKRCARDGFGDSLGACEDHLVKKAYEGLTQLPRMGKP